MSQDERLVFNELVGEILGSEWKDKPLPEQIAGLAQASGDLDELREQAEELSKK